MSRVRKSIIATVRLISSVDAFIIRATRTSLAISYEGWPIDEPLTEQF